MLVVSSYFNIVLKGIGSAVGLLGRSPGTVVLNKILRVDESSEKAKIWRTLGSMECLVELTFFYVKLN